MRGRPKKNIEVIKEEKPLRKKRGRKKKVNLEPRVKISDIEVGYHTWEDMKHLDYFRNIERPPYQDVIYPYFKKIPDKLKIDQSTSLTDENNNPIQIKLWRAKDFIEGKKKEIYFIHKHILGNDLCKELIEVKDLDGIRSVFRYEEMCIVPSSHKASQKISLDTVIENIQEAKQVAKQERARKKRDKK